MMGGADVGFLVGTPQVPSFTRSRGSPGRRSRPAWPPSPRPAIWLSDQCNYRCSAPGLLVPQDWTGPVHLAHAQKHACTPDVFFFCFFLSNKKKQTASRRFSRTAHSCSLLGVVVLWSFISLRSALGFFFLHWKGSFKPGVYLGQLMLGFSLIN